MGTFRTIEVHEAVGTVNDRIAEDTRRELKDQGTFMVNLMASPGAGKTSVLLKTIEALKKNNIKIGVMEADIEAEVDAETMEKAGVATIQVHTAGRCAMDAKMTSDALASFDTKGLDLIFLENIGNLVCPAEDDTGAHRNVCILSVPEGDDKPLKYPLMFQVCQAVIINKIDTKEYFPFDDEAVVQRIHERNPFAKVFFVSAKTGEGIDAWAEWLMEEMKK